ncbi:MAG: PD-(D/E)XK nuclease family protein [Bacteroidetes bacterium]|nr:PD-(D/E)XK nuclease family protein [Bacteroidota bacterium]
MESNIRTIETLLSQVATISDSYEKVAQATGDNFNIFTVLRIEHYEEQTHSRFIAELLNPKGSHGFGSVFLNEFLNELGEKNHIKTESANVYVEKSIGPRDDLKRTGGKIDILIEDDESKRIIIENKIYATEQENQLERYHNFDKSAKLLYLTLYGELSESEFDEKNYIPISYSEFIINWLERCQKIAVENPVVRETIKQYKNLVKKLTNQNINNEMNKEILKLITGSERYFDSFIQLNGLNVRDEIINNTIKPILKEVANKYNLKYEIHLGKWSCFGFGNDKIKEKNIHDLLFSSSTAIGFTNIVYGFRPLNESERNKEIEDKIKVLFSEKFETYQGNGYQNWIALGFFDPYRNWEDLKVLKDIYFDSEKFKTNIDEKIGGMLEIVDKL